jgi:hypothetical protein
MGLADFAFTDLQAKIGTLVDSGCTIAYASNESGCSRDVGKKIVQKLRRRAALKGYAPDKHLSGKLTEVEILKGRSILENIETGKTILQWTKSNVSLEHQLAAMQEAIDEIKKDLKPIKPVKLVRSKSTDLLNLYVLSDIHIGMKSWAEETGADWDLDIAEETILAAFTHLIASSPPASVGFLGQLGDCLHFDGILPVTPTSGHVLDVDSRFAKVVRTVVRVLRSVITMLLMNHKKVVVLMAAGNHDPASSVWLQQVFMELFKENKRLEMILSPNPYYAYKHKNVMLGFHHGHRAKINTIAQTFLGEFRQMFGNTEQTYIHTGHYHSWSGKETSGAIIEQHPTLASRDAYAAHGGWHCLRRMAVITYDDKSEICRFNYTIRKNDERRARSTANGLGTTNSRKRN